MKYDIIIIGAGITGLTVLKELGNNGYRCCLLEASPRPGGRIFTFNEDGFEGSVEGGAEFIHGKLPLTLKLINESGLQNEPVEGKMIAVKKGVWLNNEEHDDHWPQFMKELNKLKTDRTIGDFLDQYFPDQQYRELRTAVKNFAEGFDLADISKVSAFSLRKEWSHENDQQFRLKGGYGNLIDWILETCNSANTEIHYSSPVERIEFTHGKVAVSTTAGKRFEASKAVISISIGALSQNNIRFDPVIPGFREALDQFGFGSVTKFLFQFRSAFWQAKEKELGFILSDEEIPTWWTQYPRTSYLLTGWRGGPGAANFALYPETELLEMGIRSLSSIFDLKRQVLMEALQHYKIIRWQDQPFIHGGYSYETLSSAQGKEFFSRPFADTLYFTGEAFSEHATPGTVESALEAAAATIRKIQEGA